MRMADQRAGGPIKWAPPPLFDHGLVARLVEAGYVETRALPTGSVEYEITEAGLAAIANE